MRQMILLIILQISEIYVIFLFCGVFGVVNNMQTLFVGNTVSPYLPMDQPVKICVKCFWQKTHLVCIDRWKSDIAAFFKLNPGISMTHRHPANRKTGSSFVPPGETNFRNWPLCPKDYICVEPLVLWEIAFSPSYSNESRLFHRICVETYS